MELMLGTDPEVFVTDSQGIFVSAHNLIPGSKAEPFKVEGGAVQPDGLAAEFNIDAVSSYEDWEAKITGVYKILEDMVEKQGLKLHVIPYASFDEAYFDSLPPEVKILGCDPDYNYHGAENPKKGFGNQPVRTAAGHVHIGWTDGQDLAGSHFEDCKVVSRHFYNNKGFFVPFYYEENLRYQLYGMAGSFRPKPYGVELRAPSNRWIKTVESRKKMYELVHKNMDSLYKQTAHVRAA